MSGMMYMFVTQAPGEEPVDAAAGWNLMKVTGYEHSLTNEVTPMRPSAGPLVGMRRGQPRHAPFSVHKELDKASSMLFRFSEAGIVIPRVSLFLCSTRLANQQANLTPFLTFELSNSIITSFEHGSKGGWPTETIRFRYSRIKWSMSWISRADGTALGAVLTDWQGTLNSFGNTAVKNPGDP